MTQKERDLRIENNEYDLKQQEKSIHEMSENIAVLAATQKHTTENIDKLSRSVESLVVQMSKIFVKSEEVKGLKVDVEKIKVQLSELQKFDTLAEYRSSRLEKVVYGAVGLILIAVITSLISTVVSHAK